LQLTNSFGEDERASMIDKPASPFAPTIVTFMVDIDGRELIVVNE
jgi:hypothetical protein